MVHGNVELFVNRVRRSGTFLSRPQAMTSRYRRQRPSESPGTARRRCGAAPTARATRYPSSTSPPPRSPPVSHSLSWHSYLALRASATAHLGLSRWLSGTTVVVRKRLDFLFFIYLLVYLFLIQRQEQKTKGRGDGWSNVIGLATHKERCGVGLEFTDAPIHMSRFVHTNTR